MLTDFQINLNNKTMKLTIISLVLFSFLFSSCKKESESNSNSEDYFEITLDGQTYSTKTHPYNTGFQISVLNNQKGCVANKIYSYKSIGRIMTTGWDCEIGLNYYQNFTDFKNSVSGSYRIPVRVSVSQSTTPCNLDLNVYIDNNPNNSGSGWFVQPSSNINTITSIRELSQATNAVKYMIKGTFSCTLKTPSNRLVPVTGKYQTSIETLK